MISFLLGLFIQIMTDWEPFFKVKGKKGFQLGYGYEFLVTSNSYSINNSTHELMIRIDLKKKTTTNPENTINETTEDEN